MTSFDDDLPGANPGDSDLGRSTPKRAESADLIEVRINGDRRLVPRGLTVGALLSHLEVGVGKVAVERNRAIVPKSSYDCTPVEADDVVEIVSFMGGG